MLVLSFPAAQYTHELQSGGITQTQGVPQGQAQLLVPSVRHIQHFCLVRVQPSAVVEEVSAQNVFLAVYQLVIEEEEAALLHFALTDNPGQLSRVDQLGAALQHIASLRQHVEKDTVKLYPVINV